MNEEQERLWGIFTATGRVEDYLQYKASMRNAYSAVQAPHETDTSELADGDEDEGREGWL